AQSLQVRPDLFEVLQLVLANSAPKAPVENQNDRPLGVLLAQCKRDALGVYGREILYRLADDGACPLRMQTGYEGDRHRGDEHQHDRHDHYLRRRTISLCHGEPPAYRT